MENKTIYFKVSWNKNEHIYACGYVEVTKLDDDYSDIVWYYYDGLNYSETFYIHNDDNAGDFELEQFENDYISDAEWINSVVEMSEESENKTLKRANCTVIVGEDAQ